MQNKFKILIIISFFAVVGAQLAFADSDSELILNLLIKKGIITRDEITEMKAEIAHSKADQSPAQSPSVSPSSGAPGKIEERVSKLEDEIKKVAHIGNFLNGDMRIGGYIQTRYTTGPHKTVNDTIAINSTHLNISGHIVPEVSYKLDIGPHKSTNILYDAWGRLEYFPKAKITFGQFKVPFSEEQITSASELKTPDRSIFQSNLTLEYSQGLMVDGDILQSLYYAVAVVSGLDRSPSSADNEAKDVITRWVYTPFQSSANEALKGLKFGTAYEYGRQPLNGTSEGDRARNLLMIKYVYQGFAFITEYVQQTQEQTAGAKRIDAQGWYIQTSYKFPVKIAHYAMELEPLFKVEDYDPNISAPSDRQNAYSLGLNLYLNKYVYLMPNYQWRTEQREISNNRFILQGQVKF